MKDCHPTTEQRQQNPRNPWLTFPYTDWLIGILIIFYNGLLSYYNPYMIQPTGF